MLLVHPDRGAVRDEDALVQDGVLHDGMPADTRVVQDDRPVHPRPFDLCSEEVKQRDVLSYSRRTAPRCDASSAVLRRGD